MMGMRIVAGTLAAACLLGLCSCDGTDFASVSKSGKKSEKKSEMQRSLTQMQTQKPHILVFLQGYLELKAIHYMKIGRQPAGNN